MTYITIASLPTLSSSQSRYLTKWIIKISRTYESGAISSKTIVTFIRLINPIKRLFLTPNLTGLTINLFYRINYFKIINF